MSLTHVAFAYLASGELARADSVIGVGLDIQRSLTARPDTLYASLLGMRGSIANARGAAAAERAHREVLDIRLRLLDGSSDLVGSSMNNLAVALGTLGRWADAESLQRASLAIATSNHPPPSLEVTNIENCLATALDLQGKYAEAETPYADVLAQRERLLGREHPDYATTLMNYAGFECERGHYELAAGLSRQLLALRDGPLPESHRAIASALQTLGLCLDGLGRHDEAERALNESLALRRRYLGEDSWLVGARRECSASTSRSSATSPGPRSCCWRPTRSSANPWGPVTPARRRTCAGRWRSTRPGRAPNARHRSAPCSPRRTLDPWDRPLAPLMAWEVRAMEKGTLQIVIRHLTGSRATHVDVVPLGAHRELILGRARSAAVRFAPRLDDAVGRYHARIEPDTEPGRFLVTDLGSRNGTLLNGLPVTGPTALRSGDVLQLGVGGPRLEFLLSMPVPAATA
ncbi:MAG: tetratricopeptide repeat protein [bacterium]|nr:tetratricopeptide repeat protein [bacterium]